MRLLTLFSLFALTLTGAAGVEASSPAPDGLTASQPQSQTEEIMPVEFPRDEAPHEDITEWWYYTGHLFTENGDRYGFEYVFFQVKIGPFAATYLSHFAITDNPRDTFTYDQRAGSNDAPPADEGFRLQLDDWEMQGSNGSDQIKASLPGYEIDLTLTDEKGPILHDGIGFVDFGVFGESYYYSRTRMAAAGQLVVNGEPLNVTGEAWMDHQWGDFITTGGGWDWFAVQLDNGEDLMVSIVRDAAFSIEMAYATLVRADGSQEHIAEEDLVVNEQGEWTSPHTGATYPAGWTIELPKHGWQLELEPTMPDQELDTRASTGTVYWEGEIEVTGTVGAADVTGLGYVELTGYFEGDLFRAQGSPDETATPSYPPRGRLASRLAP